MLLSVCPNRANNAKLFHYTMKTDLQPIFFTFALLAKCRESWAFSNKGSASFRNCKSLSLSSTIEGKEAEIIRGRDEVLELAQKVFHDSPTGVFITDSGDRSDLKKAVARLEATTDPPTNPEKLLGCWKLICTTNTAGFPTLRKDSFSGIPFLSPSPLKENIRNNAIVYQKIWNERNTTGEVFDRVDNIIEISADGLIEPFLNPLDVTKTKFTLIHKVESNTYPILRTKISLQKVLVTIAGKSRFLDASGADVFGINIPLGDLFNSGSFDTTYVDEKIRVSRGTIPFFDELRVFIKVGEDGKKKEYSNLTTFSNFTAAENKTHDDLVADLLTTLSIDESDTPDDDRRNNPNTKNSAVVDEISDSANTVWDGVDTNNKTTPEDTSSDKVPH